MKKEIGFIGLGRMGSLMVENLLSKKYKIVAYNRSKEPVRRIAKKGAIASYSLEELIGKLKKPRIIVLMVTAGKPVDLVLNQLTGLLEKGDIVIEGGNSYYQDSIKRHNKLKKLGINFLDMGTSGGLEGARNGASLMIGGNKNIFKKVEQLFKDLAIKDGYGYMGESGSGHFVKTVHNGIEYSVLESYAEGYAILKKSKYKLNLEKVSKVWSNGSVIRSWITELAQRAFRNHTNELKGYKGKVGGGETGMWASKIADNLNIDVDTLKHAIFSRKRSMKKQTFATKFVAAIRKEFGGHKEPL